MNTYIDPQMLLSQMSLASSANNMSKEDEAEGIKKACQEFEAILIQTIYKGMKSTVPDGGLLPKNMDQEIFEEFMFREVALQTAREQSIGIAEMLYRDLKGPDKKE